MSGGCWYRGSIERMLPPNVDVLLIVEARGYERWFYADVALASRPVIRLSSGRTENN